MPNWPLSAFVGTATKCLATAFFSPRTFETSLECVGVGHAFQCCECFRRDNNRVSMVLIMEASAKSCYQRSNERNVCCARCMFSAYRPSRSRSEPPMPMLMTFADGFACVSFHSPLRTRFENEPSWRTPCELRHQFSPLRHGSVWVAQGSAGRRFSVCDFSPRNMASIRDCKPDSRQSDE